MKNYFQAPWSLKETAKTIIETIFLVLLAIFAINYFELSQLIEDENLKIWFIIGTFLVLWGILLVPMLLRTWKKKELKSKNFGFEKIKPGRVLKLAIGGYLIYHIINALIVAFMFYTNIKIPGYQAQELFLPIIGDHALQLALIGIVMVAIGPIVEEVFFRGFLLRSLSNRLGYIYASLITAAIFALFHFQFQVFIPIFILGLIINYLVIHSKSIWTAIVFHAINNGVVFLLEVLILKGVIPIEKLIV